MPRACPAPDTTTTDTPPPKRARVTGKPRCPARPYHRVETAVMKTRIEDYTKKMEVLQSKTTLLRQRLEMHKLEMEMREGEEAEPAPQ
jgi:hypothetical protein